MPDGRSELEAKIVGRAEIVVRFLMYVHVCVRIVGLMHVRSLCLLFDPPRIIMWKNRLEAFIIVESKSSRMIPFQSKF